ncbi:thiamine pyrophosphate-dependent dehydrogenase E1 component subunit alpha [Microbacterium sp. QXD-8]|uniref:Thiamine pyrophosphate-dependent dehydrogenase E1 component subunit alpha n=1 Tax=Microbacterium psychrotolerans TaxID=3068321 RepID=A0ABU0YZ13_9MICO|nr:thiamine pyrophosphate-dependent dehydrogenase E1 component subunit alpha [Microbacterium sp. QXD-8]MDQ7876511.1 thiamine pyrophosphate-dependent dehydrogenase E1 component subunit alpha [Microbacterium sp. QXD-8]
MSDEEQIWGHLERMRRIRSLEEKITELRATNQIVGSVHLCNGQEAIYVGACAALDLTRDAVFPTYRGHGWAVACGVPPHAILAELLGRSTGISGGRGGSAYFTAPDYGFYGENSIVGAGAPIATGAALAATFDGSGRVAVASFGDGALNQGAVHEAMNFAAVRSLPVIFIVENNGYSELTPISAMVKVDQLFRRANAYGMPGARVDGNDPVAVSAAVAQAVERARRGKGPVLLEMITQRLVGHYIGDVQHYRPEGELAAIAKVEPIVRLEQRLIGLGRTRPELDDLHTAVRNEIDDAAAAALGDQLAPTNTVLEHLYA